MEKEKKTEKEREEGGLKREEEEGEWFGKGRDEERREKVGRRRTAAEAGVGLGRRAWRGMKKGAKGGKKG